jgi:hypothetical protein
LAYPKCFAKIASYLENKSIPEVVWYYYNHKRTLELKKKLREQQIKKKGMGRGMR